MGFFGDKNEGIYEEKPEVILSNPHPLKWDLLKAVGTPHSYLAASGVDSRYKSDENTRTSFGETHVSAFTTCLLF